MYIKIIRTLGLVSATVLLLGSCVKQHSIDEITDKNIKLSLNKMMCFPENLHDTTLCPKYKYVVYVDSVECSPCKIAHLGIWNYFRNELLDNDADIYIIFISAKDIVQKLLEVHSSYKHRIPIYIDTLGVFERDNPHIAEMTTEYHNFLLDQDNNIVAFGDASTNHHVRDEIYSYM